MQKMRWKVQLEGHRQGLEQLSESFEKDPRISSEDGEYYLWSPEFEQLNESSEVRDVAENIVRIVRQLGELNSIRVEGLDISCVVELQEDGSERMILQGSVDEVAVVEPSGRASIGEEELPPRAESTYEYTQLALKDGTVRELIELRNNGNHWVNLYRIYEYIQDNIESEDNIVDQGWWSDSEKGLFKRTANSPEAIGHEARHAVNEGYPAPPDPMDHTEAKSLINHLISNWLRHRIETLELYEDEN